MIKVSLESDIILIYLNQLIDRATQGHNAAAVFVFIPASANTQM